MAEGDGVAAQRGEDAPEFSGSGQLGGLAEFAASGSAVTADPHELLTLAVAALPSAAQACLTVLGPHERIRSLACTSDDAEALDRLQDELRQGPAADAVHDVDVVRFDDLSAAPWPAFVAAAAERGVRGLLSVRVRVDTIGVAALTFYAERADAFTDSDAEIATICGSFLGLMLRSARERERSDNLEIALDTNRQIGTAIGILMARDLLTADAAFDRLREASQRSHRKLRAIADEVIATGQLPG